MKWTDATNYSRTDKERTQTSWQIDHRGMRIFITKKHLHYPGEWIMHCKEIGIQNSPLGLKSDADPEEAKKKALIAIKRRSNRINMIVDEILYG